MRNAQFHEEDSPAPDQISHTSNILRLLMEELEKKPEAHLLDVGPLCNENIQFFARRIKALYICDLLSRLDRAKGEGRSSIEPLTQLNYPPQGLDAILLWHLLQYLEDADAASVAQLCHSILKPGGKMFLFVTGERMAQQGITSFIVEGGFRFQPRSKPHLNLHWRNRQNREILDLVSPFRQVKSFLYRNGFREFLFQRS